MNREGWNLPMHPMRRAIPRTAVPHVLITAMAQTCSKSRGGERDVRSHCVASERTKVKGRDVRVAERRGDVGASFSKHYFIQPQL